MNWITRRTIGFVFVSVEALLIILAIVFNVQAHYLKPIFVGVAIISIPCTLLTPSRKSGAEK
jgi:hypothetical protein